jgi:hypothetical protein
LLWQERVQARAPLAAPVPLEGDERVSVGRDGHVLQLSAQLAYEWAQ